VVHHDQVEGSERRAGAVDRLYRESLGVALADELVDLGSGEEYIESAVLGGLTGVVASYVEVHSPTRSRS
jgi:hypothetical protein